LNCKLDAKKLDQSIEITLSLMITSDELLYQAARDGNLKIVEDLLSKGTGTRYKDGVLSLSV
jgi:hypothetical protein